MCIALLHAILHRTPDNLPSYPPDNHHCSEDVCLREGEDERFRNNLFCVKWDIKPISKSKTGKKNSARKLNNHITLILVKANVYYNYTVTGPGMLLDWTNLHQRIQLFTVTLIHLSTGFLNIHSVIARVVPTSSRPISYSTPPTTHLEICGGVLFPVVIVMKRHDSPR